LEKSVVLEVIFYDSAKDIGELKNSGNVATIICPSPSIADGLRRYVGDEFEILTISKWVSELLKLKKLERINKAQLMLRLASVWKHYFPEGSSFQFFHAFELFTELRSFTLDLSLLTEFLNESDEILKKSIFIFWTYLENEKIIDEHLSYALSADANLEKPIWLIGFKNMSGIQLDMLKNLAERQSVTVFIPRLVYHSSISSDWTKWLVPDLQVEDRFNESNVKYSTFPKNKLNFSLSALRKIMPEIDIVIAGNEISLNHLGEVSCAGDFFKTQEDFFKSSRQDIFQILSKAINKNKMPLEQFRQTVTGLKEQALLEENFIKYKIIDLAEECLEVYKEFQTELDEFSLKIFQHVVELNSPRVFAVSQTGEEANKIQKIDELSFLKIHGPTVLLASSDYGNIRSAEKKLNESLLKAIKNISPIKRAGLEFLFVKNDILNLLAEDECFLLIEEGLDITDLSWREIISSLNLNLVQIDSNFHLKKARDFLQPHISFKGETVEKISASRLQVFIDCPRKYYFNNVDKIDHRPEQRLSLGSDEMGTIEHEVIKNYFEMLGENIAQPIREGSIEKICHDEINKYLSTSQITLSSKSRLQCFYEIFNYSKNAIEFLGEYIVHEKATGINFEVPLEKNPLNLVGFIDCIVFLPEDRIAVFDFKRSSASIGSKIETMSFNKIQIWVYLVVLGKFLNIQISDWGYLNLAEINESLLFNENQKVTLTEEIFEKSSNIIENKILELKNERIFPARPRVSKVCQFCEVSLFCPKGECK
jgi:RecB family exonuclease